MVFPAQFAIVLSSEARSEAREESMPLVIDDQEEMDVGDWRELRCTVCNKLLAKKGAQKRVVEIKCVWCGNLNSIFHNDIEQVIVTNPDGVIIYANPMVETVTGYKLEEVIGNKPSLWGGLMTESFYKKMWRELTVEKKSVLVKVKNRKKDGSLYYAMLQISPVLDTKG